MMISSGRNWTLVQQDLEAGFASLGRHLSASTGGAWAAWPSQVRGWPGSAYKRDPACSLPDLELELLLVSHWSLVGVPQDDFCHSGSKAGIQQRPPRPTSAWSFALPSNWIIRGELPSLITPRKDATL